MAKINVTVPSSGNNYSYEPYSISTTFKNIAGNYMFAYQQMSGNWVVLYVGQTNDLSKRFGNHDKLKASIKDGATHILVHASSDERTRKNEEKELIAWLKPKHNELLK